MPELLSSLWSFVHGEMTLLAFEELVYGHSQTLGTIFPKRTVSWLLELDYRDANAPALRFEVGTALATVAKGCVCLRFPSSAILGNDHVFIPESASSTANFVEQHIRDQLALIGKDPTYAGRWQRTSDKAGEETRDDVCELREGCYYCCRSCGRSFLMVQYASEVDYLVLSLSARELTDSTPQLLRKRFEADFEIEQIERSTTRAPKSKLEES